MKKLILLCVLSVSAFAHAKTVNYQGEVAESFIGRHFPDAAIPGPVEGIFHYINRHGQWRQGYASCFVPAMGGRSNGEVSFCQVEY